MADVFLSYSRQDKALAGRLVELLEGQGWDVFWDQETRAGTLWPKVLEDELNRARCLIVLWTSSSISSRWVRIEADEALQNDKLLPVRIESVKPPMEFRQTQTLDLVGWTGEPTDPRLPRLFEDLRAIAKIAPRERQDVAAMADAALEIRPAAVRAVAAPPSAPTGHAVGPATADSMFDADGVAVAEDSPATTVPAAGRRASGPATQDAQVPQDAVHEAAEAGVAPPSTVARASASRGAGRAGLSPTPLGLRLGLGAALGLTVVVGAAVWWPKTGIAPPGEPPVAAPGPEVVTAPAEQPVAGAAEKTAVPPAPALGDRAVALPAAEKIAAHPPPRTAVKSPSTTLSRCIEIADKFQTTGQLTDEERRFLSSKECAK